MSLKSFIASFTKKSEALKPVSVEQYVPGFAAFKRQQAMTAAFLQGQTGVPANAWINSMNRQR